MKILVLYFACLINITLSQITVYSPKELNKELGGTY
jgi:hypothetical protein